MASYTATYYTALFVVAAGGSFQFYSACVVNPTEKVVKRWIQDVYTTRGTPLDQNSLMIYWSVTVSSLPLGAAIGCILTRTIADRLGRRDGLIMNGVVNVLGALFELFSSPLQSPVLLVIGRLFLGWCVGVSSGLAPMYLMELSPQRVRGRAGALHQIASAASDCTSIAVALPQVLGTYTNWPYAYALPGLSALLLVFVLPFMPRSPRHLLLTRHDSPACIAAIAQCVNGKQEQQAMLAEIAGEAEGCRRSSLCHMVHRGHLRRPLLLCVVIMCAQMATGAGVIFMYSTQLFEQAGVAEGSSELMTLGIAVAYFCCAVLSSYLIERWGRRLLVLVQLIGCALCITLMAITAALPPSPASTGTSIVVLFAFMCIYGLGAPIAWLIANELFAQQHRSTAVTVSTMTSWSLATITSALFPSMQTLVGRSASFAPFVVGLAFCIVYIGRHLPETRDRSISEVTASFVRADDGQSAPLLGRMPLLENQGTKEINQVPQFTL